MIDILQYSAWDVIPACFLAFGFEHALAKLWAGAHDPLQTASKSGGLNKGDKSYMRSTFLYGATHSLVISSRVYLALVATDALFRRFPSIMTEICDLSEMNLRHAAPGIAFTVWGGLTFCTMKRIILLQLVSGRRLGRMTLIDMLVDFLVVLTIVMSVMDQLKIDFSVGVQSVLSMGGIGALIFSLAAKDLAEQIVGGVALHAWDALNVGDKFQLGDGTVGTILEIGLVETQVQGFDNIVTRIPNSQLTSSRVSNISRVKRSRLKQELRFKYSDLDILPTVLAEIKEEVRLSCPLLAKDTAFHAVLVQYESDHIAALVQAHFEIPPMTGEFISNRQDFVLAIHRAMKKHSVTFAIPTIEYHNVGPAPLAAGTSK